MALKTSILQMEKEYGNGMTAFSVRICGRIIVI